MRFIRLAAPLLLAVGSHGLNSCLTDDACSSGSTTLEFDTCDLTDEDASDLAACFDSAGRGTIESVIINSNDITTLAPEIFDGLEALTNFRGYLDDAVGHDRLSVRIAKRGDALRRHSLLSQSRSIDENKLVTLPAGLFDGMANLGKLDLGGNDLFELPTGIFKDLTSLEKLLLRENDLVTLPARLLEGLISLDRVWLEDNDLDSLPEDLCRWTPGLDNLTLTDNKLELLPSSTFDGCDNLTELILAGNELETLPEDIFLPLESLETLSINYNDLSTLPATIFQGNPALTRLYLDHNELDTLPPGIFDATPALRYLYLYSNVGMTVSAGLLAGLTSLNYLDLDDNEHTSLPTDVFDSLSALETLYLSDNSLTTLPAGLFDGLGALENLWLRDNEDLQCIPETEAENVYIEDDAVGESGICECPEEPTCDENGNACDCQPGANGYSCVPTGSSSEVVRAFDCSSIVPPTGSLVDAAERTTVTVQASGFDERTSGYGCSPAGCTADDIRDRNLDANSRWSCKGDLLGGDDGVCCIEYSFEDPQKIVTIEIVFHEGTKTTRTLNVYDNDELHSQVQSSGSSVGYQEFVLNTDGTSGLKFCLDELGSDGDDWLSITKVQFMVK